MEGLNADRHEFGHSEIQHRSPESHGESRDETQHAPRPRRQELTSNLASKTSECSSSHLPTEAGSPAAIEPPNGRVRATADQSAAPPRSQGYITQAGRPARTVSLATLHPHCGPVDQVEDRYLGMVEAASSNLARSTILDL